MEIHFPVLFATWRSVFAGVCSPRANHPKTQRELSGVPRDISFLVPWGKQSSGGDPRSGWQHSMSDHLLPPGVQHCLWIVLHCALVPHQLVCVAAGQLTWGLEAPWTGCSLFHSSFPSELRDHRPERRWASHEHFIFSLSQNHRITWFGWDHSRSSCPIVLILRRLWNFSC